LSRTDESDSPVRSNDSVLLVMNLYCWFHIGGSYATTTADRCQVVALLQTMPQDAPFRVDTAMMQGREDIVHIDQGVLGCVWMSGEPAH
jgi:hypothetical protein